MVNEKQLKRFCCEPIENIQGYAEAVNDTTQTYDCHHLEEDEGKTQKFLKSVGRFYKVPAAKLVLLTHSEHIRRHQTGKRNIMYGKISPMRGKRHSDETKIKISNAHKGKVFTEEHKKKLSEIKTKYHIDYSELRHLREDLNYTLKQCAEYYNTSLMTVSRACRKIPK